MFRAFSFEPSKTEVESFTSDHQATHDFCSLFDDAGSLESAVNALGSMDAEKIRRIWFRQCDADVFLSHSSDDDAFAKSFGAYLSSSFGLKVFIDSLSWHHMDEMLSALDKEHCVNERGPDGKVITYSYAKRNVTTAHVHMILSHALTAMIFSTECFIYLKTPNSAISESKRRLETFSPWLFHELAMVDVIEPKDPLKPVLENFSDKMAAALDHDEGPRMRYCAPNRRLINITMDTLRKWEDEYLSANDKTGRGALEVLYKITNARSMRDW